MPTEKGWFIRTKGITADIMWSLRTADGATTDLKETLLFMREQDAKDYLEYHFHKSVQGSYEVSGIH